MNIKTSGTCFLLLIITSVCWAQKLKINDTKNYFIPSLVKGQKLANIYSRTIAVTGEGFAPIVNRVSGSSSYLVVDNNKLFPVFEETDIYDGRKPYTGTAKIGINGENTYNGKAFKNTSASGLLYNEMLWGSIPVKVKTGDMWEVKIEQPWELGGTGVQKVEVISLDKENQTIMLKREGNGEGFFDAEGKELSITTTDGKKIKVTIAPGKSHWFGYTIFKNGIVISDELLVTRPLKLTADNLTFNAEQREYILLNAMPVE